MLKGKAEKVQFSEEHDSDYIPAEGNSLVKVAPKKRSKKLSKEEQLLRQIDLKKTQREVETLFNLQQDIEVDQALQLAKESNLTAKKPSKKEIRQLNKLRNKALKDSEDKTDIKLDHIQMSDVPQ